MMSNASERRRSPLLAMFLSIVPGLGQVYAGYWKRGAALFIAFLAQIGVLSIAGMQTAGIWLILLWIWSLFDAWKLASSGRTSIMFPVALLTLLNLAIGWQLSDIGTQIRQVDLKSGLGNARHLVSALVQPDLLQTYELQTADAEYIVPLSAEMTQRGRPPMSGRRLLIHTPGYPPGRVLAIGEGFAPLMKGALYLKSGGERIIAEFKTDASGHFECSFRKPVDIPGRYWIQAEVKKPLSVTQWRMSATLDESLKRMLETVFLAFIGTAIALIISLPLSFLAARNLASQIPAGWALYSVTRAAFNILRSIEALIIAVIMAIIVGIGPLAGALALSIHGIGALGKLYSEAIESVEHGPIEAVMSTGANWMQVVRFGAVPQVVPQFISFTMYRWDINVRMATVIGLVGGGGIGNLLYSYINGLQWEKAATAIWLIAVVVMLMDYASAVIRERVV